MNPRRRARLRRRRHLRAWVKTWVHWAPWDWAEAWKECAATGSLHPLKFYSTQCIRGWRRWGARELATALRAADQEQLVVARMHDQAAERARTHAQQARDLLASLVRETGVSP